MKQLLHLVQRQHVEVTDVVLLGVSDPGPALLLVNHLSHVLADKLTLTGWRRVRKGLVVHLIWWKNWWQWFLTPTQT